MDAGDIAASKFLTGFNPDSSLYEKTHALISDLFNKMVNASIPGSVIETPNFFSHPNMMEHGLMLYEQYLQPIRYTIKSKAFKQNIASNCNYC